MKVLSPQTKFSSEAKWQKYFERFRELIEAVQEKELPPSVVQKIEQHIDELNAFEGSASDYVRQLKSRRAQILKLLAKEANIVSKHYYRNLGTSVGMAAFGIPFGVLLGLALGNMAFLGIGLPVGMALGMGLGNSQDEKAAKEGRQLPLESDY